MINTPVQVPAPPVPLPRKKKRRRPGLMTQTKVSPETQKVIDEAVVYMKSLNEK